MIPNIYLNFKTNWLCHGNKLSTKKQTEHKMQKESIKISGVFLVVPYGLEDPAPSFDDVFVLKWCDIKPWPDISIHYLEYLNIYIVTAIELILKINHNVKFFRN